MWQTVKTTVVVIVITALVWLWAEGSSLTTSQATPRIEMLGAADLEARIIEPGWMGAARVKLRGSRSAVNAAERLLAAPLQLSTGIGAVPGTAGEHALDLREALRQHPELRKLGIGIDEVEPATLRVLIEEMATRVLPARLALGRLEADGAVKIEPPTIAVRLPKSLADRLDPSGFVPVALDADARMRLREDEAVTVPARVLLPEALMGTSGVSVQPASVSATLRLRARK